MDEQNRAPGSGAGEASAPRAYNREGMFQNFWANVRTRQWWENYWYYYKWPTIIVVVAALLIGQLAVSMLNKPQDDARVLLICRNGRTPALENDDIAAALAAYATDFDGKDGLNVAFEIADFPDTVEGGEVDYDSMPDIYTQSGVDAAEGDYDALQLYLSAFAAVATEMEGDTTIYLFDQEKYEEIEDKGIFLDLGTRYGLPLENGHLLPVSQTVLAEYFAIMDEEFYIVARDIQHMQDNGKAKVQAHYEYYLSMLDALVAGQPVTQPAA